MKKSRRILIITGEIGSGKTSLLHDLVTGLRTKGFAPAGIISPGRVEDGTKTGIRLLNVKTGDEWLLAELRGAEAVGPATLRWQFYQDVMDTGNQILGELDSCDFLFIDELGPLEFLRKEGWQSAFTALEESDYNTALVVIRPGLLDVALKRWPSAEIFKIHQDSDMEVESEVLLKKILEV